MSRYLKNAECIQIIETKETDTIMSNNFTVIIDLRSIEEDENTPMSIITDEDAERLLGIKDLSTLFKDDRSHIIRNCYMDDLYNTSRFKTDMDDAEFIDILNEVLVDTEVDSNNRCTIQNLLTLKSQY